VEQNIIFEGQRFFPQWSYLRILALFFHPAVYGKDHIGGIERRFIEVSKIMQRKKISVYTLEFYPSLKRFLDTGYVSYEMTRQFPKRPADKVVAVIQALRLGIAVHRAKKFQLLVVTGHRYVTFTIVCAYILAKLLQVPWVIVSGGLLSREKMSLSSLVMERRKRGFIFPSALAHTIVDWFTKLLFGKVTAFVVVSGSEKRDAIRFLGVNPVKIHVVGNGANLDLINSIPEREKQFDGAFLGRVEPGKGLNTLIRSWGKVTEHIPSAQLVIIGGGRLTHYEQLVKSKNLSNNIRFVGFVPFEHAMTLLKQSKIFLFPSKRESFPLSLLEAMACGLPCVASSIQPLIENFKRGVIFAQPNSFESFTKVVVDLLNHADKREAIGAQAREYAEMFSWENVVRREIEVLTKLLK